jgi:hypothetical protein
MPSRIFSEHRLPLSASLIAPSSANCNAVAGWPFSAFVSSMFGSASAQMSSSTQS